MTLATGAALLPESTARLEWGRSEIRKLFGSLRAEAEFRSSAGRSQGRGAPFGAWVLGQGIQGADISEFPILRDLLPFQNEETLSDSQLNEVFQSTTAYCLDFILGHRPYFQDLLKIFIELYDPLQARNQIKPEEIEKIVKTYARKRLGLKSFPSEKGSFSLQIADAIAQRELQHLDESTLQAKLKFAHERIQSLFRTLGYGAHWWLQDYLDKAVPRVVFQRRKNELRGAAPFPKKPCG